MPSAIKAFAVNTSASSTIYTVPIGMVAKILLSSAYVLGDTGANISFNIGTRFKLVSSGNTAATFNLGKPTGGGDLLSQAPVVLYLAEGQTIATVKTGSGTVLCQSDIAIIEEIAS